MSDKKDGWYHSRDKRAKYVHFFRGGKPLCGIDTRQDIPVDTLPAESEYKQCPHCMWWYQNLFQQSQGRRSPPAQPR